jgi:hypothetical protein
MTHFQAHMRNNLLTFLFQPPPPLSLSFRHDVRSYIAHFSTSHHHTSPGQRCADSDPMRSAYLSFPRCLRRPQMIVRKNLAYEPWMSCRSRHGKLGNGLGVRAGRGSRSSARHITFLMSVRVQEKRTTPHQRGSTRLLHILISEAAHRVWMLRCERVIGDRKHTQAEIKSKMATGEYNWIQM